MVKCEICGIDTDMDGTKRCNRCWELEHRILEDPELAQKIIAAWKRTKEHKQIASRTSFRRCHRCNDFMEFRKGDAYRVICPQCESRRKEMGVTP